MCLACQEMDLYDAYLDAVEAGRREAQPDWRCEVTLFPVRDEAGPAAAASPFVCDSPE